MQEDILDSLDFLPGSALSDDSLKELTAELHKVYEWAGQPPVQDTDSIRDKAVTALTHALMGLYGVWGLRGKVPPRVDQKLQVWGLDKEVALRFSNCNTLWKKESREKLQQGVFRSSCCAQPGRRLLYAYQESGKPWIKPALAISLRYPRNAAVRRDGEGLAAMLRSVERDGGA